MSESSRQAPASPNFVALTVACALAITLLRAAVLFATDVNLGPDEAQYWDWSRNPAFGYFSKPPLIAWLIGATTLFCGDGEACVRLASPLAHCATSLVLYLLARDLYGAKVGCFASVTFLTLPGISFSSFIVSTDVPLLFFWSAALLALHRWLTTGATRWALALGAALGLGVLSKYAMAYIIACALVYFLVLPHKQRALLRENVVVVIGVAALMVAPNVWWNLQHGFVTLSHTAANASWGVSIFNFEEIAVFFADQTALFGPILLLAFAWCLGRVVTDARAGKTIDERTVFLVSFALPVLVLILIQSFISRSNANWTAVSYPAATILVTSWLCEGRKLVVLAASLSLHLIALAFLSSLFLSPRLVDAVGADNAFKRVRGWDRLTAEVHERARQEPKPRALLFDDRLLMTEFLYYGRHESLPSYIWDRDGIAENHYELTRAFTGEAEEPILLVARREWRRRNLALFAEVEDLGVVAVPVGGGRQREVRLYRLSGYHGE